MRLAVLALSLPVMFTAMGLAMLWLPHCQLPASITLAYLTLTPIVYYARRRLYFSISVFAKSLAGFAALWAIQTAWPTFDVEYMRRVIQTLSAGCPNWEIYLFTSAVVLAPFVEEALFRVVLYGELEKRVGVLGGYLANSLAFAVVHGIPQALHVYFAMGLLLTHAYRKGGYLTAVALHSVNNLLASISLLFP